MTTYIRCNESNFAPLFSWVRVENGDKVTAFQLQPERPLTAAERSALESIGVNPSEYVWVGYPVPANSEPVQWSKEIADKVNVAKATLAAASGLRGELVQIDPDNMLCEMFGDHYEARHFIHLASGPTEDEAESNANFHIRKFNVCFPDAGLWDKSGTGNPATAKYSF